MKVVRNVSLPSGLTRVMLRIPIYLFRLGLGRLFGQRLLLLNHTGRITGKSRHTVLEVVDHDSADDSYVVASGGGRKLLGTATSSNTQTSPSKWEHAPGGDGHPAGQGRRGGDLRPIRRPASIRCPIHVAPCAGDLRRRLRRRFPRRRQTAAVRPVHPAISLGRARRDHSPRPRSCGPTRYRCRPCPLRRGDVEIHATHCVALRVLFAKRPSAISALLEAALDLRLHTRARTRSGAALSGMSTWNQAGRRANTPR